MTLPPSWRNLRSVMVVTLHVALVSAFLRYLAGGVDPERAFPAWFTFAFIGGSLLVWPLGWRLANYFDAGERLAERSCPRCRRNDLRPLIRPGVGLFQPVSSYRCASCWTKYCILADGTLQAASLGRLEPLDPDGIEFLDQTASPEEIRFLDESSTGRP